MADRICFLKIIFILALWNINISHIYATCDASFVYWEDLLLHIQYSVKQNPSSLDEGETIYFSCDEGFRLRGASSLTCLSNGSLEHNGMMSHCERIRCFKYNFDSSIHTSPDLNSYDFNQTVNFSCDDDQILYGPSSARCTQNGWEYNGPSWPVCGNRYCYVGEYQYFPMYITPNITGDKVEAGTRIYFHCQDGYYLRCAKSALCLASGQLIGINMMCECQKDNPNSS